MYLTASKSFSGDDFVTADEQKTFNTIKTTIGLDGFSPEGYPRLSVDFGVAYWRKANAIHKWFVENVQEGEDNCQRYYVTRENLEDLIKSCKKVLKNKDAKDKLQAALKELPPQSGFFFGSTEIDEDYWLDLESTINQIQLILETPTLKDFDFHYQSSW